MAFLCESPDIAGLREVASYRADESLRLLPSVRGRGTRQEGSPKGDRVVRGTCSQDDPRGSQIPQTLRPRRPRAAPRIALYRLSSGARPGVLGLGRRPAVRDNEAMIRRPLSRAANRIHRRRYPRRREPSCRQHPSGLPVRWSHSRGLQRIRRCSIRAHVPSDCGAVRSPVPWSSLVNASSGRSSSGPRVPIRKSRM